LKQDTNGAREAQASGRISYREAGAAQRAAWDRAMAAEIPTAKGTRPVNCMELRALNAVLHFTTTYSRLTDRRSVKQIAEVAGCNAKTISRALKVLNNAGIAYYTPGGKGQGHVSTIGVPPAEVRGTTNRPPIRGTTNGPPKDGLGGRVDPVLGTSWVRLGARLTVHHARRKT
jgi:hypothetical protein